MFFSLQIAFFYHFLYLLLLFINNSRKRRFLVIFVTFNNLLFLSIAKNIIFLQFILPFLQCVLYNDYKRFVKLLFIMKGL